MRLIISPQPVPVPTMFSSDYRCSAAYLPNTILDGVAGGRGGGLCDVKNVLKAANLCEWLRGIMLSGREK